MTESKRTKRVRDVFSELSLDEHIVKQRNELVHLRMQAPSLRKQAEIMRGNADKLVRRYEQRKKMDLYSKAQKLEREADVRDSMIWEHDFEKKVVTYSKMYHQQPDISEVQSKCRKTDTIEAYVRHNDVITSHRSVILDEYLTEMHKAPPKVAMALRDECPYCKGTKLLLCSSKSIMSCPECGYSVAYLDTTSSSTPFDEVVEFSQYSYKRVNHYVMWLALVQGKEPHRVPDDILQMVMEDLYSHQQVRSATDVTQKRVRESLRRLRLRKAYDHVAQITSRISGVKPPRISAETEEQLKNMFLQMQPAFQKNAPKSRTNFLSYTYVLYRCFQILGLHHMLSGITLLKGRDKLEANDNIFRKMCLDLGWPIFDLPPASETTF
jgi:ribosomal protein L37AE/L43A